MSWRVDGETMICGLYWTPKTIVVKNRWAKQCYESRLDAVSCDLWVCHDQRALGYCCIQAWCSSPNSYHPDTLVRCPAGARTLPALLRQLNE